MKRSELKKILEKKCGNYVKLYRQYPTLHRDLVLWEDYLLLVEMNRNKKIHAPKDEARISICEMYCITDKTFYVIRDRLLDVCDDVKPSVQPRH